VELSARPVGETGVSDVPDESVLELTPSIRIHGEELAQAIQYLPRMVRSPVREDGARVLDVEACPEDREMAERGSVPPGKTVDPGMDQALDALGEGLDVLPELESPDELDQE
jgi:hypothetical protein